MLAHLRGAELGSLNENFYAKRVPLYIVLRVRGIDVKSTQQSEK